MLREREQRIREFAEMNARLNQMKDQFKREMMRSASELVEPKIQMREPSAALSVKRLPQP
jgi:hypothetical protein